jgi:hypothetical protein
MQMQASFALSTSEALQGGQAASADSDKKVFSEEKTNTQFRSMKEYEASVQVYDTFKESSSAAQANPDEAVEQQSRCRGTHSQIMRFSKTLSGNFVKISPDGLNVQSRSGCKNTQGNHAIGDMGFSEGIHYWELICPVLCSGIEFGVTAGLNDPALTITQIIYSTSKRTVGVMLDLKAGIMSFWMNGKNHKKNKDLPLKQAGLTWYPFVRFNDQHLHVVLNPFCSIPQPENHLFKVKND